MVMPISHGIRGQNLSPFLTADDADIADKKTRKVGDKNLAVNRCLINSPA
jgi:hypothetical protein